MGVGKFIVGAFFGGALSGITTLLANKRTGEETQTKIREFLKISQDEITLAKNNVRTLQESKSDMTHHLDKTLPGALDGIQRDIEAFKFQSEPRIKEIQKQLKVIQSRFEKR